jgi:hypothetical protein
MIRIMGPSVAEAMLGEMVLTDLFRLVPAMILIIALVLFLFLGSPVGILVPLLEALMVLLWTLGAMAYSGIPVTLVTTILPVVLMAMAITDEIHLLAGLQRRLHAIRGSASEARKERTALREAIRSSFSEVGPPIVATTVTAGLGFLSFLSASMGPMRQFGGFAALGIFFAMLLSFTMVPALLSVLPLSWFRRLPGPSRSLRGVGAAPWEKRVLWPSLHPALAGAILLALGMPGLWRLSVQDAWVDNFPSHSSLVQAERDFNKGFWGSYRCDVVLRAKTGFFKRPDGVRLVDELERYAAQGPGVGGVLSYLLPVRQVLAGLGETRSPSSLAEAQVLDVADLAGLWAGTGEMDRLLLPDGSATRVSVFLNSANYQRAAALKKYLEAGLPGIVFGSDISYHFSGDLPVAIRVVHAIVDNQLRSIALDVAAMALLLLLLLRSTRGMLMILLPVLAADWIIFAGMGYAGIPLGVATSMFAALTIGVGVDYGVHLYYAHQRYQAEGLDLSAALHAALRSTSLAIRWNAMALVAWFLVLVFSSLRPNHYLGVLLASAMVACYGTTFLFLPRLLRRFPLVLLLLALAASTVSARKEQQRPSLAEPAEAPPMQVRADVSKLTAADSTMLLLQEDYARVPRVVRLEVSTEYADRGMSHRVFWGVVKGAGRFVNILYVAVDPPTMAGTSLLLKLDCTRSVPDSIWLYLQSFHKLQRLDEGSQWLLMPGTALSYADAEGFLPVGKYDFRILRRQDADGMVRELTLSARPRSDAIRNSLRYDSLLFEMDVARRLITRIDMTDLNRRALKSYRVTDAVCLGGVWLPTKVRVEHHQERMLSNMEYRYWPLHQVPNDSLYLPSLEAASFLDRLRTVLRQEGIDSVQSLPD